MKTFTQILISLICLITLLNCQSTQREIPKIDSAVKVDTIQKRVISMEDVFNDSIPIWHLSQKEQWARFERMESFKYYGDIKLRKRGPISYIYNGSNNDTTVLEMFPGILNHRTRVGGRYVNKIQYFNEDKEMFKEIYLDELNPYNSKKYENLVFGYVFEEDLELIDSSGLLLPTNYVLTIDNTYQSNGFIIAFYDLYSFHVNEHQDGFFLGVETTVVAIDPLGNVQYQKRNSERKHGSYINDTGRFLCLYSKTESLPDEFEIIDIKNDEIIYKEAAKLNQKILSVYPIKTGLIRLGYETADGNHHKIQRYFDLENRIKYETFLSEKEIETAYLGFISYWDVLQKIKVDTISY